MANSSARAGFEARKSSADLLDRLIEAEPRLRADDEEVERVGQAPLELQSASRCKTGQQEIGDTPADHQGGEQHGDTGDRQSRRTTATIRINSHSSAGRHKGGTELIGDRRSPDCWVPLIPEAARTASKRCCSAVPTTGLAATMPPSRAYQLRRFRPNGFIGRGRRAAR